MKQKETDKIFNRITSNGCRDMDEVRFNQAVNEILYNKLNSKKYKQTKIEETLEIIKEHIGLDTNNKSPSYIEKLEFTIKALEKRIERLEDERGY